MATLCRARLAAAASCAAFLQPIPIVVDAPILVDTMDNSCDSHHLARFADPVDSCPSVLSRHPHTTFEKKLESHYSTKLATLTAELEAKYSTLQTSVDYLSMQQSAMKSHVISAVNSLEPNTRNKAEIWGSTDPRYNLSAKGDPRFLCIRCSGTNRHRLGGLSQLRPYRRTLPRLDDSTCEESRLFVGERLWLLFSTIRGVYGRYMVLTHMSLQENEYRDWRQTSS